MNPLDDPAQKDAYMEQRKKEARQMLDQMKEERKGSEPPSDRPKACIIGVTGPSDGFQSVDA
jgi:hypothetical protein